MTLRNVFPRWNNLKSGMWYLFSAHIYDNIYYHTNYLTNYTNYLTNYTNYHTN